jgi:pimeloyl-ACP methyl ester carboxylesterase
MPEVEGAGVALHYAESGTGPPVVLVHGLASDARTWEPVRARLAAGGARAIAYDRRGYGASGAPEPYSATTVAEQAEDAAALLRRLNAAPAVLVGDGFGALVVLDLLARHRTLVAGAVLADPPLFAFVPEATEVLAAQRGALEEALREGGPEAAVGAFLGPGAPPEALARAQAAPRGFFADYGGLASHPVTRRELRALDVPACVLTGPRTPAHVLAAADALAALLPDVRRRADGDVVGAVRALAS